MPAAELHVVTGAFGYSGRYIAQRLLERGVTVRTLTHSPDRANPFAGRVEAVPFRFDDAAALERSLRGARVLHNTYWVRFNHARFRHAAAVENTLKLFAAAKRAGVQRVVHVSITNPSQDSPLEYFSGKARLERGLVESGLPYAILRPTVLFGREDILINNIAWLLRRCPVFGLFGDGTYRLQPIYVDDLAELAVQEAFSEESRVIDAIGRETYTYRALVARIARAIGVRRLIIGVPPAVGHAIGWMVGKVVGDVVITREEIRGLMSGLLCTDSPPAGRTRLSDWLPENADGLGRRYASELARRRDRAAAYDNL